ncbi:MAG: hypothetical protein U0941_28980 [Planctomycetaceae bacterium]
MNQKYIATMAESLESLVQPRLSGRLHELRVECQAEGVVLRGWTRTYYAKQMAQQVVMDVADLPILANEIEVRSDARPRPKPR